MMKTLLTSIAAIALCISTHAADITLDGLCYNIQQDGTLKVVSANSSSSGGGSIEIGYNNGYSGEINIPSAVEWQGTTYTVTTVDEYLFLGDNQITGINLPHSITDLGPTPFANCTKLQYINVAPNNERYCSSDGVLYNAAMDTLIACPGAKSGTFDVPASVKALATSAFYGCAKITAITLPQSVGYMGVFAFRGCSSLTSVNIPQNVDEINDATFYGCRLLKNIDIPDHVTSIGDHAFYYCQSIGSIRLPSQLQTIGDYAFEDCPKLSGITLPETLRTIGYRAFASCTRLNSIRIPAAVAIVGAAAFAGCTNLQQIVVDSGNKHYAITNGALTSIDGSLLHTCPAAMQGVFDVPQGVTTIGEAAFHTCRNLTKVNLPASLQTIGTSAFNRCNGLTEIRIPKNVSSIGDYAFSNCTDIASVTAYPLAVPSIYTNTFLNTTYSAPLYVPIRHLAKYKKATTWKKFTNILPIVEHYTAEVEEVFAGSPSMLHIGVVCAETTITTMGFDVILPEGLTLATQDDGQYICHLDKTMPEGSTIAIEDLGYNAWHIDITTGGKGLQSNEAALASILVVADAEMETGQHIGTIDEPAAKLIDNYNVGMQYSEFEIDVKNALPGDVNLDGSVSVVDITIVVNEILGNSDQNFRWQLADLNHDGQVSLTDINMIVSIILNSQQ